MNSSIALFGGETFTTGFERVYLRLIDLARTKRTHPDNQPIRLVYLATCASLDGPERVDYLRERAQKKLGSMGVVVSAPPVTDHHAADDPSYARLVAEADWIYFSGGLPHVGMQILSGSRIMAAVMAAWKRGVLLSGSSAGAMLLCSHSIVITPELDAEIEKLIKRGEGHSVWNIPLPAIEKCLGLVPRSMCWPHMNVLFSSDWARRLLPHEHRFIGVDEQTAVVKNAEGKWQVWGKGKVVVGTHQTLNEYTTGDVVELKD